MQALNWNISVRVTINSDVINQLNDEYLVVPKLCLSFWCTVCISTQCSDIFVLIKKEKHTKSISLSINSWSGVIASSKSSRQFFFAGKRDRFENVHFPHVRIKGTPLPPKEKQCIISRFTTTTATILDEHEQEKREAERESGSHGHGWMAPLQFIIRALWLITSSPVAIES